MTLPRDLYQTLPKSIKKYHKYMETFTYAPQDSMILNEPIFHKGHLYWNFMKIWWKIWPLNLRRGQMGVVSRVCVSLILCHKPPFIHSICVCRMWQFLVVLRSFFYSSLLHILSFHPFPPTSLTSSSTSSCRLFLSLPLSLVVYKCIYNTFWEFYFLPFSVHAQTNVIYLTILSLLQWVFLTTA
jgi:hypothetical protein